ncbi:MAG: N-formylglutamate amidohydrolase [Acetobacteraceae bacterium]|nr:N-formylglutamate amidohydrolase [Acetobacteraceae bacterium]
MDLPVSDAAAAGAPPFVISRPARQTAPLVFTSAHSGRFYAPDFLALSRLEPLALRRSEDSFVEELFEAAPEAGAPLLAATFPRAFCDANRERWELDPAMFQERLPAWVNTGSARVGAGLGMIARIVASGEPIYRAKLPFAEAERRVRSFWQPFHDALAALVLETRQAFGACLLVDCHSMPASSGDGRRQGSHSIAEHTSHADVVLGDAYGTTCAPAITAWFERTLRALGYSVRRNEPYAGGYITRHYGRPPEGVQALQVEINRSLYMVEATLEPRPGFRRVQEDVGRLVHALAHDAPDLLGRP